MAKEKVVKKKVVYGRPKKRYIKHKRNYYQQTGKSKSDNE